MDKVSSITFCFFLCAAFSNVLGKPSTSASSAVATNNNGRIVGGQPEEIQNVPYQVVLNIIVGEYAQPCGGSIIGRMWILTAAHCLLGASMVMIRAGSSNADSGGNVYMSTVYMMEPRFNVATYEYDAGLVFVPSGLRLGTNAEQIPLDDMDLNIPPGDYMRISGYGFTADDISVDDELKTIYLPVVSREECQESYNDRTITENMVCIGAREEEPGDGDDVCNGDYGGAAVPAQLDDDIQYAIASFGSCGQPGIPSVYTKVSSVRTWIFEVIEEMKGKENKANSESI